MMRKIKWLAVAKYGTEEQKDELANNLRITPTPDGWRCPAWLAFDNSLRGFYAEQIAKCYLAERESYWRRGYRWDDDGAVYEKGDVVGPHRSEPDGMVVSKTGEELSMDVKANADPVRLMDIDGQRGIRFNRTHNADVILWYSPKEHGLHVCRRKSPKYDERHVWDYADYADLGTVDTRDYEVMVDAMLQSIA